MLLGECFHWVVGVCQGVTLNIWTFFKLKTRFCKYWISIKIKISMTCMYKDYKFEIKMVQEQLLQLKTKSLWRSNMKIVISREGWRISRGDEPLMRGNKNLVVGDYYRRIFSSGQMNKILGHGGSPIFSYWEDGAVPPLGETLIFRLLLFKQTNYITSVLARPERWHIMLFSQSALIPQLCLHFFQKLKYYTLGNKDYSRKLFWVAVAINVNAKEVKGTVSLLVKTRVFINVLIWLILDC